MERARQPRTPTDQAEWWMLDCQGTHIPTAFCISPSPPEGVEQIFVWVSLLF